MSLIEEALRKQREETEKAKLVLTGQTQAEVPPPLPDTEEPPKETAPVRKALPVLILVMVGGVLVVAGIVWLLMYGIGMLTREAPKPVAAAAAPKAAQTGQTATGAVTTAVAALPLTSAVPPFVAGTAGASVPVPAAVDTAVVTGNVAATASSTGQASVVHVEAAAARPAPEAQKIVVVVWPRLTVTGIIGTARGGKSAAIINGQMVAPGETIEGARIESIDRQGVRIRFDGESRTLSVGGSTD